MSDSRCEEHGVLMSTCGSWRHHIPDPKVAEVERLREENDMLKAPGLAKFHDDHRAMCETCREMDEALVEAHSRLSDRVAELERLRAAYDMLWGVARQYLYAYHEDARESAAAALLAALGGREV